MHHVPAPPPDSTTPVPAALTDQLQRRTHALLASVHRFHARPHTPATTFAFEREIADILREIGREVVTHAYNHAEPATAECPPRIQLGRETYRRRDKTPNTLGTLFGPI